MGKSFKTPFPKPPKPSYFVIDVGGKSLGRVASQIAAVLLGKNSANFNEFLVPDHYVLATNCKNISLTGKKNSELLYWHSGFTGGLRERRRGELPKTELLRIAVSKMLPKNRLRKRILKRLKVFDGNSIPSNIKNFSNLSYV